MHYVFRCCPPAIWGSIILCLKVFVCINGDVVRSFWRASYQEEGDEIKSGVTAGRIRTDGSFIWFDL